MRSGPLLVFLTVVPAVVTPAQPRAVEETIAVVVSDAGFRPAVVTLRKGEPIRLALSSGDREHCFALEAFRIEKRVVAGKTTTIDLTPDRVGTFPFYCCLEPDDERQRGRLVVTE